MIFIINFAVNRILIIKRKISMRIKNIGKFYGKYINTEILFIFIIYPFSIVSWVRAFFILIRT